MLVRRLRSWRAWGLLMRTFPNIDGDCVMIIEDSPWIGAGKSSERAHKPKPPISVSHSCSDSHSVVFEMWSAGRRDEALRLLRSLASASPRSWFDTMMLAEPPPGFVDDMVDLNQYDEYVVKEF